MANIVPLSEAIKTARIQDGAPIDLAKLYATENHTVILHPNLTGFYKCQSLSLDREKDFHGFFTFNQKGRPIAYMNTTSQTLEMRGITGFLNAKEALKHATAMYNIAGTKVKARSMNMQDVYFLRQKKFFDELDDKNLCWLSDIRTVKINGVKDYNVRILHRGVYRSFSLFNSCHKSYFGRCGIRAEISLWSEHLLVDLDSYNSTGRYQIFLDEEALNKEDEEKLF